MTYNLSAGDLDRRIRIESMIETRDPQQRVVSRQWALLAEVWAKVGVVSERGGDTENRRADQPAALAERFFEIRYRAGISPTEQLRVVHEGLAYNIQSVEELGRRVGLRLRADARAEKVVAA